MQKKFWKYLVIAVAAFAAVWMYSIMANAASDPAAPACETVKSKVQVIHDQFGAEVSVSKLEGMQAAKWISVFNDRLNQSVVADTVYIYGVERFPAKKAVIFAKGECYVEGGMLPTVIVLQLMKLALGQVSSLERDYQVASTRVDGWGEV